MAKAIKEIDDTESVTLEDIQSAGLRLKDAIAAREGAALRLKAAKETEATCRAQLELMTGARSEDRPLLDGGDE